MTAAAAPRSTFQPVDCHAHTTMSDGALSPAELIATVTARGVRPGIADHLSRDVSSAVKSVAAVRAYLDELDCHDVLRGGEFCWHDGLWRELPDELMRRFTHRVGSLHAVRCGDARDDAWIHMFQRRLPDTVDIDMYMDAHVTELERFAAEMPVDVFAHPTLLPLPWRGRPIEELWTEPREERAVDALFRAGIAFEISNRYRPHRRFVDRAIQRGVRVSLGSDGHTREQVGDLAWPLALARDLGVADGELYDPRAHGRRD